MVGHDRPSRLGRGIAAEMGDRHTDDAGPVPGRRDVYRKGYLKQGSQSWSSTAPCISSGNARPPLIAEDPGYDPNRDQGDSVRR